MVANARLQNVPTPGISQLDSQPRGRLHYADRSLRMAGSVHIVATGARCAVGFSAEGSAAAIRAGISRLTEHPSFVDLTGAEVICARDPEIEPVHPCWERISRLAEYPLREVARKLGAAAAPRLTFPVILALPEVGPGFATSDPGLIRHALVARGLPSITDIVIDRDDSGHGGAIAAFRLAFERVSQGHDDVCLVAGADSYLDAGTLAWLDANRRSARAGIRSGFPSGEGAAVVAFANDNGRRQLGLQSLGRLPS
jgi:3-oxoacyl-[acyl-carrier-protein] synthase I